MTPDPSPKKPKSIKWENRSKLEISDPFGEKKKSSFWGQFKSPSSEGNSKVLLRKAKLLVPS